MPPKKQPAKGKSDEGSGGKDKKEKGGSAGSSVKVN